MMPMFKRMARSAVIALASFAAPAPAAEPGKVCDKLLPCRNFAGAVTSTLPNGERDGITEQRITIFKMSTGTVLLSRLVIFMDGGHSWEAMTWDFYDDKDQFSADGKFTIYSDTPDITGSNKIGKGQCVNGRCAYELSRDKAKITGTMQFTPGPGLRLTERETEPVTGQPPSVSNREGLLELDEK